MSEMGHWLRPNLAGARVIAGFAAEAIRTLNISPLKNFLR
jgi:hypothetical protein